MSFLFFQCKTAFNANTCHVISNISQLLPPDHLENASCSDLTMRMIKIFRGAEVVTPSKPPPPTNNFCLYPPPILRCFWKDPLMTPHHPTSSTFHCYPPPHPPHLAPLKILIIHHCRLSFGQFWASTVYKIVP